MVENNVRDFTGNWTGTGAISGSGDSEVVTLDPGEYMDSEIVDTGTNKVTLLQNTYSAGDTAGILYRHASTANGVNSAEWTVYEAPFTSLGYVQVRIIHQMEELVVSTDNARYLEGATSGAAKLLFGFHTWYNVQDGGSSNPPSAFDWDEYADALGTYGCNFTKLWASLESTRDWADPAAAGFNPQYFGIHRYDRSGTSGANDGGNKFDLTSINQDYLDRLYDRVLDCYIRNIYVVVQLFQGWQIEDKGGAVQPFTYHPYNASNNINSVDGDFDNDGDGEEVHMDANNAAWSYEQDLIEAIVTSLNAFPNVIYEVSNEDTGTTANNNWQEDVVDYIKTLEASMNKQHLVMRTVAYPNGSNPNLDASAAEVVSYNAEKADNVLDGDKVAMRDSDHVEGIATDYHWIWEALCNGSGGAWYMDEWDGALYGTDRRNNSTYTAIRANLGYAKAFVDRVGDILLMTPQASLSTTGYCLARDHATDADYIAFQPGTGAFNLDLSTATGTLNVHWIRCSDGTTSDTTVSGGDVRTLTPPWAGLVAVHVYH